MRIKASLPSTTGLILSSQSTVAQFQALPEVRKAAKAAQTAQKMRTRKEPYPF